MQNTSIHHKRQYDWLKQYQWQKGQTGNPTGKNGKSAKTFARQMLMSMPDEEKAAFLKTLDPEIVWRMAEGNPHNTADVVTRNIDEVLTELEDANKITRQNLADVQPLQDKGQAKTVDSVPAEQSAGTLPQQPLVTEHYIEESPTGIHD